MSICGPVERIRGRVDELAKALQVEVTELSSRLGHNTRATDAGRR